LLGIFEPPRQKRGQMAQPLREEANLPNGVSLPFAEGQMPIGPFAVGCLHPPSRRLAIVGD